MPLYEYFCDACGERTEILQRFSDAPEVVCAKCGAPMRKLPSAPSFQFKGSGWYLTDYARKSGGTEGTSPRGGADKAADKAGEKSSEAGSATSEGAGSSSASSGASGDSGSSAGSSAAGGSSAGEAGASAKKAPGPGSASAKSSTGSGGE